MEPIGTGLANDIPSSDKNRTGPRVSMLALVNPSSAHAQISMTYHRGEDDYYLMGKSHKVSTKHLLVHTCRK